MLSTVDKAITRRGRGSLSAVCAALLLTLLAACGTSQPEPTLDLSGTWSGSWASGEVGGSVSATFTQNGASLTGTVTVGDSPCITEGSITGSVTGAGVTFGSVAGATTITFVSTEVTEDVMNGTWSTEGGACAGGTGTFSISRSN